MCAFRFDRRRLRRTAFATLVAWLLALTAGVVNACVLTPTGQPERAVTPASHAGGVAPGHHAGTPTDVRPGGDPDPGASVANSGHGQDFAKASCLKFCDDGSSGMAKVKLPVVDPAASLVTAGEPWDVMTASGGVESSQSLERPGSRGPPLVIRFLRLTL
jgi:hypothetical protein